MAVAAPEIPRKLPTITQPRPPRRRRWTRWVLPSYTALVMLYLVSPILVMILYSFNNSGFKRVSFKWLGFTAKWYPKVFDKPDLTAALKNSLLVATVSTLIATALGTLKNWHLLPQSFHVLATPFAVVSGIAYNFLPFMALPLYVALERIDRSVVEAARDLYASNRQVFTRVIFPLSVPGVFAGVLLTFVPAVGDYVNASILGGTKTTMIGNIIQLEFLQNFHYPAAAALSFILMGILLVGIFIYARVLGARSIEEYV